MDFYALVYDETKDLAYCHICVTAFKQKKMRESRADPVFVSKSMITIKHEKKFTMLLFQISTGFSNWKDATMVLRKHEQSSSHRQYSIIISVLGVHGFLFYKLGMAFASFFCFLRACHKVNTNCLLQRQELQRFSTGELNILQC